MEIGGNCVENAPRYLSKHGYTSQHSQNIPWHFKTHPGTPNTLTSLPRKASDTSKQSSDSLWGIWFVRGCQGPREDSGRNEGVRWCLLSVRNVCKWRGLPPAMSRTCQGWHWSVWDICGSLGGVGGCKGGSGRCLVIFSPSISSNFRKLQMRSLKFSSRPGGPRCPKDQNVL